LPTLHRNTNPLVDMQMRLTGDCRRQANTQTIAPLFDIENSFDQGPLLNRYV